MTSVDAWWTDPGPARFADADGAFTGEDLLSQDLAADAFGPSYGLAAVEPDDLDEMRAALRWTLHDECGDAHDEELDGALADVFDAMSPAEAFNFGGALGQIGRGLGQALADPTVGSIVRTGLPILGGVAGTVIGGPVGTALGSQLGTVVAGALPPHAPAGGGPASPPRPPAPGAVPPEASPLPAPVAGGSAAAAQAAVLSQHPHLLAAMVSAAMGQHGRTSIGGIPTAQLLGLFRDVLAQATADADELAYVGGGDGEAAPDWSPAGSDVDLRSLYPALLDADNLELGAIRESAS